METRTWKLLRFASVQHAAPGGLGSLRAFRRAGLLVCNTLFGGGRKQNNMDRKGRRLCNDRYQSLQTKCTEKDSKIIRKYTKCCGIWVKIHQKSQKNGPRTLRESMISQKVEKINILPPFFTKKASPATLQGPSRGVKNHTKFGKNCLRRRLLDGLTPGHDFPRVVVPQKCF